MANEITLASGLTVSKGGLNVSPAVTTDTLDMTGTLMNDGVTVAVTASWTALEMGSLTTAADYWVHLQNLDSTSGNRVNVSTDNGTTAPAKIPLGSFWGPCLMAAGTTVYVRAHSAACNVATIVSAA